MALRDTPERPERALSIAWLLREFATIRTPGSLAVARMTLENYGIELPKGGQSLQDWTVVDLAEQGTHILAWVIMALDSKRTWPAIMTKNVEDLGQ
jgi:hypothetical protein